MAPFSAIKCKNVTLNDVKMASFGENLISGEKLISVDTKIWKID